MGLRVVGAGLGRTGTHSLKLALEQLLGAPCYHMLEVFGHPEHIPLWHAAAKSAGAGTGAPPDWDSLFDGYGAAVDWPAAAFWRQISETYPDAVILLSVRASPEDWWRSANDTIFQAIERARAGAPIGETAETSAWNEMIDDLFDLTFTPQWRERDAAMAAYERHNNDVRATAPAGRLVEWQPRDGWEPLCAALGVDVPDEPFPHVNTTADFRAMTGLEAPAG